MDQNLPTELDRPVRAYDELTPKQLAFVTNWFQIQLELDAAGEKQSNYNIAWMAYQRAGYGGSAQNAWALLHSGKISGAIAQFTARQFVALRQKALHKLDQQLDNSSGNVLTNTIKTVLEHGEGGSLAKGQNIRVEHEVTLTGKALDEKFIKELKEMGQEVLEVEYVEYVELPPKTRPETRLPEHNRLVGDQSVNAEFKRRRHDKNAGPDYVLKEQRPDRPRRGRPPKKRLVPPVKKLPKFEFEEDM